MKGLSGDLWRLCVSNKRDSQLGKLAAKTRTRASFLTARTAVLILAIGGVAALCAHLAAAAIAAAGDSSGGRNELASCHFREFELCTVGIGSIFQNPNGLPASEAELKRQCQYLNESVECLADYSSQCMTETHMPLLRLFAEPAVELVKEFCGDLAGELRANYTKHVSCLREVQRKHQRQCVTDLQVGFEAIHKLNRSQVLQTACW